MNAKKYSPVLLAAVAAAAVAPALFVPLTNGSVIKVPKSSWPLNHKGEPMTRADVEAIEKARAKRARKALKKAQWAEEHKTKTDP